MRTARRSDKKREREPSTPAPVASPAPTATEPRPISDEARHEADVALTILREWLGLMQVDATVTLDWSEEDDLTRERIAILRVDGEDLGAMIGPRGAVLNDIQFLMRSMVSQQIQGRTSFVVDIGGYREKRIQSLVELANRMAAKVARHGRAVTLNPMPPHERRIIHMTLREDERVVTKSTGEGNRRRVRILKRRRGGKK